MKTRFAPSPTGYLHIGNMRTALLCYLYARQAGGEFILRVDDTDQERSKQEYVDGLKADLAWLGIEYDSTFSQSERLAEYDKAFEQLKDAGRVYASYETAEELEIKRKLLLSRGQPPIYEPASDAENEAYVAEGRQPHYRFKLEQKEVSWDDEIRGQIAINCKHQSDPVIRRENGGYTYMLPSTVDDIFSSITHVSRGEDHISNTAVQIQMFEALGAKVPHFAHSSLIQSKDGKLSKRKGSASIKDFRADNVMPMALASFLSKVGTSDNIELFSSMQELIDGFDITKFSKSTTTYEESEITRLNTQIIHEASFDVAKPFVSNDITAEFWEAIKHNLESFAQADEWYKIIKTPIKPLIDADDSGFISSIANLLPQELNEDSWSEWINSIKAENPERKGKGLFMPIRKALTAQEHGPEMGKILPLIDRAEVIRRLTA